MRRVGRRPSPRPRIASRGASINWAKPHHCLRRPLVRRCTTCHCNSEQAPRSENALSLPGIEGEEPDMAANLRNAAVEGLKAGEIAVGIILRSARTVAITPA